MENNNISLVSKYETEDIDEENKAMELFGLKEERKK